MHTYNREIEETTWVNFSIAGIKKRYNVNVESVRRCIASKPRRKYVLQKQQVQTKKRFRPVALALSGVVFMICSVPGKSSGAHLKNLKPIEKLVRQKGLRMDGGNVTDRGLGSSRGEKRY